MKPQLVRNEIPREFFDQLSTKTFDDFFQIVEFAREHWDRLFGKKFIEIAEGLMHYGQTKKSDTFHEKSEMFEYDGEIFFVFDWRDVELIGQKLSILSRITTNFAYMLGMYEPGRFDVNTRQCCENCLDIIDRLKGLMSLEYRRCVPELEYVRYLKSDTEHRCALNDFIRGINFLILRETMRKRKLDTFFLDRVTDAGCFTCCSPTIDQYDNELNENYCSINEEAIESYDRMGRMMRVADEKKIRIKVKRNDLHSDIILNMYRLFYETRNNSVFYWDCAPKMQTLDFKTVKPANPCFSELTQLDETAMDDKDYSANNFGEHALLHFTSRLAIKDQFLLRPEVNDRNEIVAANVVTEYENYKSVSEYMRSTGTFQYSFCKPISVSLLAYDRFKQSMNGYTGITIARNHFGRFCLRTSYNRIHGKTLLLKDMGDNENNVESKLLMSVCIIFMKRNEITKSLWPDAHSRNFMLCEHYGMRPHSINFENWFVTTYTSENYVIAIDYGDDTSSRNQSKDIYETHCYNNLRDALVACLNYTDCKHVVSKEIEKIKDDSSLRGFMDYLRTDFQHTTVSKKISKKDTYRNVPQNLTKDSKEMQ
jgi:hypothetical protein